eukprot:6208240-Pleurochrysis_carterae.AAC.3
MQSLRSICQRRRARLRASVRARMPTRIPPWASSRASARGGGAPSACTCARPSAPWHVNGTYVLERGRMCGVSARSSLSMVVRVEVERASCLVACACRSNRDYLVVGSDSGKIIILEYSVDKVTLDALLPNA